MFTYLLNEYQRVIRPTFFNLLMRVNRSSCFSLTVKAKESKELRILRTCPEKDNNINNNVHLSCADQGPELSHDTY